MGSPEKLAVFLVCILNFVLITESVNPNCNYYQYLQTGTVYWFPASSPVQFQAGADCLWYAESASGTRISLNCTIKMPTTLRCSGDRLMVSVNGDANYMSDASYHCGTKTFTVVSNSNSMAVALKGTSGGTFYCSLQTVTQSTSCDCGWRRSTRIVNGVNSGINEYPATAAMIDTSLAAVKCGSIIVSNRFVLTAAHCMRAITLDNMAVLVGDWDLYTGSDTPAAAIYQVLDYTEHPNFNDNTKKNDIAIVRTLTEITFSLLVGPICLPFAYEYTTFDNQDVTMLGWGELFFNGPMADILQKVVVQVITNNACNAAYGGNITQNQMCTYTPNKDSCQGDSGGPLFWQNPSTGRVYVVGIISYGYGCATTKPGVSTRVTSYLQWIVSKINAIPFCVK